jgi:choline dehydrogenase-like flavoprotein
VLDLVADTLLPRDGTRWREDVAQRAWRRLEAQPELGDEVARLRMFLRLLDTSGGGYVLGGQRKAFSKLDRTERELVMARMLRHPVGTVRGAALALKRLIGAIYYADSEAPDANPNWTRIGYPGPPDTTPVARGSVQLQQLTTDTTLDCDVVVVGSGAGGGIIAAELARQGHSVIVLERGPYLTEPDFDLREMDTFARAYLDGGLRSTADLGTLILAGACLGGGTVVNYTTSFRTPDDVRAEWSRESGLDLFTSAAFTTALDRAERSLGVNQAHNRPSMRDEVMQRGLHALGWHVDAMPRNVDGCTQDDVCGYCGLGCVRGAKRSTVKACLEQACADGARVFAHLDVSQVLIERGRAVGVVGHERVSGLSLTVRARRTVVAAGALGTPALLSRSGVGGPVGQYLRLHPVTAVWGYFPDEAIRPWTGTLQALYSTQLADLDGTGYGARFETAPVHPSLMALAMPWESPTSFDRLVSRLAHISVVGVLTRDRGHGQVMLTRRGQMRVRYRPSRYDQRHIRQGVLGAAQALAAAGASEILATQHRYVPWRPASEPLHDWTARLDRVGFGSNRTLYVSFHQMGTCRMGRDPRASVVDDAGQLHSLRDLYVADGSLFPTASGVNPMLTIAALAHHVADCVQATL